MAELDIIPDGDAEKAQQVQQLAATQEEVTGPDYAKRAGLLDTPPAKSGAIKSWGELVKDHPVLSQQMVNPDFAFHAQEDVPQLSKIERLFGGWDEMAWKSKLSLEEDQRNQELAVIGRAQRWGKATPEQLKRADEIEKETAKAGQENKEGIGFVPGIAPAVVGATPGMSRASGTAALYGVLGTIGGTLLSRNPKIGLSVGAAMAGHGLTVGMSIDTAKTEEGLAYRQYVAAGADPAVAGVMADVVALANGGLQAIPAEKVLNMVPGISKLIAGKATRDLMGKLLTSNTGKAALGRFAGRVAESGLLMALVGGGQELVRELGGIGAGVKDEYGNLDGLHPDRLIDAGLGGLQQGLGFGAGHAAAPFAQERQAARLGQMRGEMYKAIAGEASKSKLRENMPEQFKNYVNAVIAEHGNMDEAKAPAEALTSLLQKEGITQEALERDMPTVAKQLKTAKGTDEIVIPMADIATHLAPLEGFNSLAQDLRYKDELTPRESNKIGELADKYEKENAKPKGEDETPEASPERRVYDDVLGQLTAAGQSPEVAAKDAALWAAFAKTRGERMGVDPFDYYKQRSVTVGAEFPGGTVLAQRGEIRRILSELPKGASLLDLRRALEGVDPEKKITDAELESARELRAHADKIADFGEDLKRVLRSGADVPDDQLSQFLASEKSRKEGRIPSDAEIDAAVKRAREFQEHALEQPAYHGTPHEFTKFTLDHIGSGEGAQAYGWGLYFAESKAIAEFYKNKLAKRNVFFDGKKPESWAEKRVAEDLQDAGLGRPISFASSKQMLTQKYFEQAKYYDRVIRGESAGIVPGADYQKMLATVLEKSEVLKKIEHASYSDQQKHSSTKTAEILRERMVKRIEELEGHPVMKAHKEWIKKFVAEHERREAEIDKAFAEEKKKGFEGRSAQEVKEEIMARFMEPVHKAIGPEPSAADFDHNKASLTVTALKAFVARLDKMTSEEGREKVLDAHLSPNFEKGHGVQIDDLFNPKGGGKLHEVELPDKDQLLDYDAPLYEQPKEVQEKVKKVVHNWIPNFSDSALKLATGQEIYEELSKAVAHGEMSRHDKAASQALLDAGIPGLKYLDGSSRKKGEGNHNFVIWDEEAIKTLNILEQQGTAPGSDNYRGKISFDDARSYFRITLTGKANLSTFLHESGHAFFEFMRMDAGTGHEQSKEDFGKLLAWMGVKDGEQPSVDQLETFARGFEQYLMEGKAPSRELRSVFRTFASWLKQVYGTIKSLGVNLTDDARGVMDRMLASEKEIEDVRKNVGFEPMEKAEGVSDAEYDAYKARFGKALADAEEALERESIRAFKNVIGEERNKVRAEVEALTEQDPARNAYEALRNGKRLDGAEIAEEVRGKKLSREAVRDYPGFDDSKKWTAITAPDGLDPEIAAPYFGYDSGQALLEALDGVRNREKEIKEETARRMTERYPESDMKAMSDQAAKTFHESSSVRDVLWEEAKTTASYMRGLEKQTLGEKPDYRMLREVIKENARRRVEEMTGLEMQPGRFARAEEKAAREWQENFKKGDFEAAYSSKLEQILNHEMFKQVTEAREEVDGIRNYLDKFNELPNRRRIGKAGQSYLNAIDAIIQDIELKRQTNKTIARRASLESYLQTMESEDGALLAIPADLRSEVGLKNYKQMSLDELRTVRDAVTNIETMARLKNKLFDGRERRNFLETAVGIAERTAANLGNKYGEKPGDPQNPGWFAQKKAMLRSGVAEMKKIEFIARAMDGGETAGFVHERIFQPFATAEAKALEWKKKITEELLKPLREMSLKERSEFDKTVDFLGTPMKIRDVIAVALNMGNEGNKKKLIDGYGYRGWTEEKAVARLGELLTGKHLDLIQHFWKTIDQLWPEIKSLSERTTGVAPPRVEASKLTIGGRELEGGYYPIVYDRDRNYKAEQNAQKKGDLFENNFLKPGVSKGFTESRVTLQNPPPILLSLNVIPAHLNEVIHYITHLEPIRAVDRLMGQADVRRAVTEGLGRETYNLFRPWLQAIAHEGAVSDSTTMIDNTLRHLRVGASVTRLGFKLTNSIMQGFNLLSSVKELGGAIDGTKYLSRGLKTWISELESMRDPFAYVHENSPEIRGKTEKIEHNLVGDFNHFTSAFSEFGHYKERLGHFALSFMTLAWKSIESLTWYAAREKAFDIDHPHPNEYADSVVRMSQMGEGMKDKAAIMRGGEGTKIFTYMYSWYSTIFNQLTETQPRDRGGWEKAGTMASRYFWMILAPTVLMNIARGKHPKHDDGSDASRAEFIAQDIALETAKGYLGPIGGITADTMISGHDAKFAPWISTVLRGLVVRGKMLTDGGHKLTDHEKKDLFESTGIVSHLPAGGLYNALKYVQDLQDGKLEEPIKDLLFRSPGDFK